MALQWQSIACHFFFDILSKTDDFLDPCATDRTSILPTKGIPADCYGG